MEQRAVRVLFPDGEHPGGHGGNFQGPGGGAGGTGGQCGPQRLGRLAPVRRGRHAPDAAAREVYRPVSPDGLPSGDCGVPGVGGAVQLRGAELFEGEWETDPQRILCADPGLRGQE